MDRLDHRVRGINRCLRINERGSSGRLDFVAIVDQFSPGGLPFAESALAECTVLVVALPPEEPMVATGGGCRRTISWRSEGDRTFSAHSGAAQRTQANAGAFVCPGAEGEVWRAAGQRQAPQRTRPQCRRAHGQSRGSVAWQGHLPCILAE
jgi:hypothetical protein